MNFPQAILTIFLHYFMTKFAMSAPNIKTDEAALLQLKAHISLDPHNFFAHNWNLSATSTSNSVCNWAGVTCGSRHRRVTTVKLPNMGFGGTIPPHVGNLSFLVYLDISGNSFHGTIPNELKQLRRLKIVDLSNSSLSGSLPDDLCNIFPELESFDVSLNKITGQLSSSLGDCNKLKRLSISVNKITGTIPRTVGNLTELRELHLHGNNLEGIIQPCFLLFIYCKTWLD